MAPRAQTVAISTPRRPLSGLAFRVARHLGLAKLSLCYLMTASAFTAYVARKPALDSTALGTLFCLFLLCLGSATLNNYQDREIDSRLRRTRRRALARGEISPQAALIQAAVLILAGTLGLFLASGSVALPLTGLIAVGFYNGIYTPLKRTTILAIIPGAVCGMLPVLMGWMAAGGGSGLGSPKLWILMVVFGVWQLPHFWLVVLAHREDYSELGHTEHAPGSLGGAAPAAGVRLGGGLRRPDALPASVSGHPLRDRGVDSLRQRADSRHGLRRLPSG